MGDFPVIYNKSPKVLIKGENDCPKAAVKDVLDSFRGDGNQVLRLGT